MSFQPSTSVAMSFAAMFLTILMAMLVVNVSGYLHPCPDTNSTNTNTTEKNASLSDHLGGRCLSGPYYLNNPGQNTNSFQTNPNRMGDNYNNLLNGYSSSYQPHYGDYRGSWPVGQPDYQYAPSQYGQQQPGQSWPNYGYSPYFRTMYAPQRRSGYDYPTGYNGPGYGGFGSPIYGPPIYGPPSFGPPAPGPGSSFQQYRYPYFPTNFQRRSLEPAKPVASEPKYLGRGDVQSVHGTDADLVCAFHDPTTKLVSNVAWVKVTGPYDAYSSIPPFECTAPGCNYVHLNAAEDFRYRVATLGQASTLRIYDVNPNDYGIYRCAATGVGSDGNTLTMYRIIEFIPPPQPYYGK